MRLIVLAVLLVSGLYGVRGDPPVQPVTKVTLVANDYTFSPAEIRAVSGGALEITVVNHGQHVHGLRLVLSYGEVPFPENVPPGRQLTETFTNLGSPGRYRFYCPVEDHDARGMHGTLIVTGPTTSK